MKKITITLSTVVMVLVLIVAVRNCTKSKLLNDLESKAEILDTSLNNKSLQNYNQFLKEVDDYLNSVFSTLGGKGIFFGQYLSLGDKEIILDNLFNRLLKFKEVLLNNENFYRYTVFLSWEKIKNKFFSSLERVCLKNNDKELSEMIDKRQKNGTIAELDISAEDETARNQKIPDPIYRQRWISDKTTREIIQEKRTPPKKELPPGTQKISAPKQEWVTTRVRTPIGINEIHNHKGEKLHFVMNNGREYDGEIENVDERFVHLKMKMAGGSLRTKIIKNQIKTIEKVTVESKYVIVEPEEDTTFRPMIESDIKNEEFEDLIYYPAIKSNTVGIITRDLKLYFISASDGKLVCHSKITKDDFIPTATKLKRSWYKDIEILTEYTVEKRDENPKFIEVNLQLKDFQWLNPDTLSGKITREIYSKKLYPLYEKYRSFKNYQTKSDLYDFRFSELKNVSLRFKIKLTEQPPQRGRPKIFIKNLELNTYNILLIFNTQYQDRALYHFDRARFGNGEHPWEFDVIKTVDD